MLPETKAFRFEGVVRAFSAELYRYAYWLCRDRFLAEDLVQETFARAWKAWDALKELEAAKGWLYTILRNEHARLFERKQVELEEHEELDELVDARAPLASDGIAMREALEALSPGYREPLVLQVLGGYSCAEIAHMMNLSEGAVMTRLTRARLALRKLMGGSRTERKVKML